MHQLVSLPAAATFAIALVFGLALTVASFVLLNILHRHASRPDAMPVPPLAAAVITVWALALGFTAADIWSVNTKAEKWASQERSSISRLAGMASEDALNSPSLLEALRDYTTASTEHEWEASANSRPAAEVDEALQKIRLEIVRKALAEVPDALIGKMVVDFDELQDARNARLGIGAHSVSDYKWYLVLILTVLSLVTTAVIHADRPVAGRTAIVIFVTVSTVSLWILVLHANPYVGVEGISPDEVNSFPFALAEAAG